METATPTYRTLHFIVAYGDWIARGVALAVLLMGGVAWVTGGTAWFATVGIFAAGLVYLIMQSYAELVRVIVEMLLPK